MDVSLAGRGVLRDTLRAGTGVRARHRKSFPRFDVGEEKGTGFDWQATCKFVRRIGNRVAGGRPSKGVVSFYCSTPLWRPVAGDLPLPESISSKAREVLSRWLAVEELADEEAGEPREEYTVSAMAGCIPEAAETWLAAEDRQSVRRDRSQAGPRSENRPLEGGAQ